MLYIVGDFNIPKVTDTSYMFNNVENLETIYVNNDIEYARIDDPTNGKPGYFTLKN